MSVILSWNKYWLIDCEHTGKLWRLIMIEWQWWFLQRCQEDIGNRHVETWSFWWFWWWWWRQLLVTCVMELEYYSLVNLRTEGAVVTDWPSWKRRGLRDFFLLLYFHLKNWNEEEVAPGRALECFGNGCCTSAGSAGGRSEKIIWDENIFIKILKFIYQRGAPLWYCWTEDYLRWKHFDENFVQDWMKGCLGIIILTVCSSGWFVMYFALWPIVYAGQMYFVP